MKRFAKLGFLFSLACCLVGASPLGAQLSAGFSAASFQFNLSNPGARSLGMGGAFTGLADDATAAYANPAGLTILVRPEISFEGRTARFRLPLVAAEPIVNGASLQNQNLVGETEFEQLALSGLAELTPLGSPDATGTNASFVSFVYPVKQWTFALYRHQLADLEAADGTLLPRITTRALENTTTTSGSTRTRARVDVASVGVSVARQLAADLAGGVTLVRNQAQIAARRSSHFQEEYAGRFEGTSSFAFENHAQGKGTDLTVNAGLLLRPAKGWAIGLSFRQGPSFQLSRVDTTTISSQTIVTEIFGEDFRVPDTWSLGASYRPAQRLVISMEWDRVGYSKLSRPVVLGAFLSSREPIEAESIGEFDIRDVDELRAGFEYTLWNSRIIPSLRFGVWHDPAHKIRFTASARCPGEILRSDRRFSCTVEQTNDSGPIPPDLIAALNANAASATAAEALALLFPSGSDQMHVTAGFGVVLGSRFQFDAAFDYVDDQRYAVSLSGIVQF